MSTSINANVLSVVSSFPVRHDVNGPGTPQRPDRNRPGRNTPDVELPTSESLTHDMAGFSVDIGNVFRNAGVHVPPDPVLSNDYDGNVVVVNDHPDKTTIERLFKDNPELQQRYAKISAGASLLRAGKHYTEFVRQYQRMEGDLAAQSALVGTEIMRNKERFFLVISEAGVMPLFGISNLTA